MYQQSEKNLLNSISISPHSMTNLGPLTAEIGLGVWGTRTNFDGFHVMPSLLQRRRSPEATLNFARCLAVSWPGTLYMHFGGSCPLTEFCQVQNSLYVQVLRSPILAALLHGTPAVGVSQTLWRGTRNEIVELLQRSPRLGSHHDGHRPTF